MAQIFLDHRQVRHRSPRLLADLPRLPKLYFPLLRLQCNITQKELHPLRLLQLSLFGQEQLLTAFFIPRIRPRVTLGEIVDLHHILGNSTVRLARRIRVHKLLIPFPAIAVIIFQQPIHHIRAHQKHFALIADPECRIDVQPVKMFPHDMQAEAVDRRDLGKLNQDCLLLKMFIFRLRFQFFLNRRLDPLPHLRRCRPGKSHDKQAVYVLRVLPLRDHLDDPLNQPRGLAASGRCRHQEAFLPPLNYLLLFPGPIYCHFSPFPFS